MPAKKQFTVNIHPMFKLLLVINSVLCVVTLLVMIYLGTIITDEKTPILQERLFNACEKIFTLTAGAFIGLLGGRAASADMVREDAKGQSTRT
jgi:hypothetical protein